MRRTYPITENTLAVGQRVTVKVDSVPPASGHYLMTATITRVFEKGGFELDKHEPFNGHNNFGVADIYQK